MTNPVQLHLPCNLLVLGRLGPILLLRMVGSLLLIHEISDGREMWSRILLSRLMPCFPSTISSVDDF